MSRAWFNSVFLPNMLSKDGTPELTRSWLLLRETLEPTGIAAFRDEAKQGFLFLKFVAILQIYMGF